MADFEVQIETVAIVCLIVSAQFNQVFVSRGGGGMSCMVMHDRLIGTHSLLGG